MERRKVDAGGLTFDVGVAGPDDGRPVLLLHGFPQAGRSWEAVAAVLAAAGHRVIAPDQRGYSPGARPAEVEAYAIGNLVGDALALLDAFGVPRADVVGHDWGAIVAWSLAIAHPDRVRTLTAVSVPHPAAFDWARRNDADQQERSTYIGMFQEEGKAERLLLEDGARRLRATYGGVVPPEAVEDYVRRFSEPGALTAALNWYRARRRDGSGPPADVTVPTTYVWSTADQALGRAGAERCADHVTGPYTFAVLEGVSHWVPEEAPDRLAELVEERMATG
ncbi:MAG TPA: alpha/beta hydrolase [Streptosporangiaceae bacterium]